MSRKIFGGMPRNSLFWKLLLAVSALIIVSLVIQIMAGMYFGSLHDQKSFYSLVQDEVDARNEKFSPLLAKKDTTALKQAISQELEVYQHNIFEIFDENDALILRYPQIQNDSLQTTAKDIRFYMGWVKSPWKQFLTQLQRELTRKEQKMLEIYSAGKLIYNDNLVGYFSIRDNFPERAPFVLDITWQGLMFSLVVTLLFAIPMFLLFWGRIKSLINVIRKYREGNLETRFTEKSKDEIGMVGLAFNKMAAQIEENIATIKQYDMQRREFTANVSHDLRTPLTSIIGYVETILMKWKNADPESIRYLETINTNASFMSNMIADLTELSKLENRQIEMRFEPHQFDDIVGDIVMGFASLINNKNIQLTFDCPDEMETVLLDKHQIERVVQNLYKNAIKFTPQNGAIAIEITETSENVVFSILDNGPGIDPKYLEKVFDRFFRTKESKKKFEGTGLGLAIAKEIVHNHNGNIHAESEVGKGAKFWFEIPRNRPNNLS
ncbi:HAMP domain-containing histidine kinase [bacterium]|nr:HAMP domain-containing histidine kinase [bacterium]